MLIAVFVGCEKKRERRFIELSWNSADAAIMSYPMFLETKSDGGME